MARILSGIQPSGTLHIGNYFGMMKKMIESQDNNELFCFIVNYHAMTTIHEKKPLADNTIEAAIDFLALGLDPDKTHFWVQGDIPEVTELAWILSCHTSFGLLERSHSYKDKIAKGIVPSAGLFFYPVLMAADILMFNAEVIPVGKDQKQHVEITRDIAERFNSAYGEVLTIPEPLISEEIAVIPGVDGQKMSKSYGNTINMFEDEKSMKKKIMRMVTDSTPVEAPKNTETCSLFALYKLVADTQAIETMREKYNKGGTGYGDVKKELAELMLEYFRPFREKRSMFEKDRGEVVNILKKGAEKTREIAKQNLDAIRNAVGLNY